jgi:hypothetical protein
MKILGKTDKGFVCELSEDEFNRMIGFRYESDEMWKFLESHNAATKSSWGEHRKIKLGAEIPIAKIWDSVSSLREKADELNLIERNLRGVCDAIKSAAPMIGEVMKAEKKKV